MNNTLDPGASRISDAEQSARKISNSRTRLQARLLAARSCLTREVRRLFAPGRFDFEGKRLMGDGVVLQWKVREYPGEPISYMNQQTNQGCVTLERAGA